MKVRSLDDLTNAIDSESGWRKKEISDVYLTVLTTVKKQSFCSIMKASIPIYYSHWEGFLKNAAAFYLEYVSRQKLPYSKLQTNFITVCCKKVISEVAQTNKTIIQNQLIDFLVYNLHERSKIPYKNMIETESNLSSNVTKNIFETIGIQYDNFWVTKSFAIDNVLLRNRNMIAHGEKCEVNLEMCKDIHDLTIEIIDYAKTGIVNAAYLRKFQR